MEAGSGTRGAIDATKILHRGPLSPALMGRMRVLSALSGVLSLFVSQPISTIHPSSAVELVADFEVSRTLVGDWEPPAAVVVVYTDGWDDTLATILDKASSRVPVLMFLEKGMTAEAADDAVDAFDLAHAGRVVTTDVHVDSVWARDYAPLQVWEHGAGLVWLDAPYDDDRPLDDEVPASLAKWAKTEIEGTVFSIDGGAVASNGDRFCVATIEYFLENEIDWRDEHAINPLLSQIGCQSLVLVPALLQEETKHVDALMQFTAPDVLVVSSYDPDIDPEDAERTDLAAMAVKKAAKRLGRELTIIRVPAPAPRGRDYPSYVNFLRLSDIALVPSFTEVRFSKEMESFDALQRAMPGVELVAIPADEPVDFGGAVHCLTWGMLRAPQVESHRAR